MVVAWSSMSFFKTLGMRCQGGLMYGLYSRIQSALKASSPAAWWVVFHGVITVELVVEARSEQVYPRFEFHEAACSLKYLGVKYYVILVAFPVVRQDYRTNLVVCHAILGFVNKDVASCQR